MISHLFALFIAWCHTGGPSVVSAIMGGHPSIYSGGPS